MDLKETANLKETDSPELANSVALDCAREAAREHLKAELMELRRKEYQVNLRDQYMAKGSNKTTAEDQVRADPGYLEYASDIEKRRARAEELRGFSRYFFTRASILLSDRVQHVG